MKIPGSIIAEHGIAPFLFDSESGELEIGCQTWERAKAISEEQASFLRKKIMEKAASQNIIEIKFGEFYCDSCKSWCRATSGEWSLGMCLSCSMDRDSECYENP